MKEKWTQGPWEIGDENNQCCEVQIGATVCGLSRYEKMSGAMVISREEMLANAHLIITAPKLYATLKELCDLCMGDCDDCKVSTILKEARGEA